MTIKCPKCGSLSHEEGCGSTTAMYFAPYTDEQGNRHHHDYNHVNQQYRCLKCNHDWCEPLVKSCWCGWRSDK
jgi:DNA-directed RNA polymerase subunit RPC12/RpoP